MSQRTELKLNIVVVLISQIIMLIANFFTKQAILLRLGAEFMGLQTVCGNLCDVLTMAYFAAGMVMLFHLYKPIEENDHVKLSAIYSYSKVVFRSLTLLSILFGGALTFLVIYTVQMSITRIEIIGYYWLYLFGVLTYNRFLNNYYFLMANQKRYIASGICGIVDGIALVFEVLIITLTEEYSFFLCVIVVKNILESLFIKIYCVRHYPFIKDKVPAIDRLEKREIRKNIYDMFLSKVGSLLLYNTDSVIISAVVSTIVSGYYSCYYFIAYGLQFTMVTVFDTLTSKIGQLSVHGNKESQYQNYIVVSLVNICSTTICIAGFFVLAKDFLLLWVGESVFLDERLYLLISINLFISMARYTSTSFRQAEGLFEKISWIILFRGVFNIILSIILGIRFGLLGVIIATAISDGTTVFWYEPYMVLKYYKKKINFEIIYELLALIVITSSTWLAKQLTSFIIVRNWFFFLFKGIATVAVCVLWILIVAAIGYFIYKTKKTQIADFLDIRFEYNQKTKSEDAVNDVKFSFILPVYNGEDSVKRAVESVLTERSVDVELIVIDDGSTDNTLTILQEMEQLDSRLHVIHTENQGQGLARNVGIKEATGDYLAFIDADDVLLWDGMHSLVDIAKTGNWDVVCGNYYNITGNKKIPGIPGAASGEVIHSQAQFDIYQKIKTRSGFGYCWNKLYRKEFIDTHQLSFDDIRKIAMEDTLFNLKVFSKNPRYYYCAVPMYEYYVRSGAVTHIEIEETEKYIGLLNYYMEYLSEQQIQKENMDLLVPLCMRVFCWVIYRIMIDNASKSQIQKAIECFLTDENFTAVISDTNNIQYLKKIPSVLQRYMYQYCFNSLNRYKAEKLSKQFLMGYPIINLYMKQLQSK